MKADMFVPDNPTSKAIYLRDRLEKWIGITVEKAESVHIVMRINGKDVRYEFDWVKELLK